MKKDGTSSVTDVTTVAPIKTEDGGEFNFGNGLSWAEWGPVLMDAGVAIYENAALPECYWNQSNEKYNGYPIHAPGTISGVADGMIDQVTQTAQLVKFGLEIVTDKEKAAALWSSVKKINFSSVKHLVVEGVKDKWNKYVNDSIWVASHELGKDMVNVAATFNGGGFLKGKQMSDGVAATGDGIGDAAEKAAKDALEKGEKEALEKGEKEAAEQVEKEAADEVKKETTEKVEKEAAEKTEETAEEKAKREAKEKAEQEAREKAEKDAFNKYGKECNVETQKELREQAKRDAQDAVRNELRKIFTIDELKAVKAKDVRMFVKRYGDDLLHPENRKHIWEFVQSSGAGQSRGVWFEEILNFYGKYKGYTNYNDIVTTGAVLDFIGKAEVVSLKSYHALDGARNFGALKGAVKSYADILQNATLAAEYAKKSRVLDVVIKSGLYTAEDMTYIRAQIKAIAPSVTLKFTQF